MSLINEALKKAQAQQKAGQKPADSGTPPADRISPAGPAAPTKKTSFLPVIALLGSIVITFAAIIGLIVWGVLTLRENKSPTADVTPSNTAQSVAAPDNGAKAIDEDPLPPIEFKVKTETPETLSSATDSTKAPEQTTATAPTETTTPAPAVKADPPPPAAPVVKTTEKTPEPAVESKPAVATAPSTQPPPAPEEAIPDPLVQDFIQRLQVRGVMSGGKKALIFNEETQRSGAYESGSTINNELRIRILTITEHSITFIDHAGVTYLKKF